MKSLCIIVALVAFAAYVQADSSTQSPYDKFVSEALGHIETGANKFKEATGIETNFDKAKMKSALDAGFQQTKKNVDETLEYLKANANSEKFAEAVNNITQLFNDAAKNVHNGNAAESFQKHAENFEKGMKAFVQKMNDAAKAAGSAPSPQIQNALNDLAKYASEGAKGVTAVITNAINEAQKKSA